MVKANIIVVENERVLADGIQRILNKFEYTVSGIAYSGEEAIKKVEETRPDLVLMDIDLGGQMTGIEAAGYIRSHFDIPVVYITGFSDEKTLEKAKVTEPFGYIVKPFKQREIFVGIEIALYKYEMEKKLRESEERYRSYVAATSQIIWTINPEESNPSDIMTWREIFTRQRGKTATGKEWLKMIHPDDCENAERTLFQAVEQKSYFESRFRRQVQDRGYEYIILRGVPVSNKDGSVKEWIGTCYSQDMSSSQE